MKTELGKIEEDITVTGNFQLNGMVVGSVIVEGNAYFRLNGTVTKDITVKKNGDCRINGTVGGSVISEEGNVEVFGVVQGSVIGRAEISPNAIINQRKT